MRWWIHLHPLWQVWLWVRSNGWHIPYGVLQRRTGVGWPFTLCPGMKVLSQLCLSTYLDLWPVLQLFSTFNCSQSTFLHSVPILDHVKWSPGSSQSALMAMWPGRVASERRSCYKLNVVKLVMCMVCLLAISFIKGNILSLIVDNRR